MSLPERAVELINQSKMEERLAQKDEVLITPKQYAELKGLHVQTVYTAIRFGRLPHRIEKPTGSRMILIAVPRESIRTLTLA